LPISEHVSYMLTHIPHMYGSKQLLTIRCEIHGSSYHSLRRLGLVGVVGCVAWKSIEPANSN
jgi:hypothetical protein